MPSTRPVPAAAYDELRAAVLDRLERSRVDPVQHAAAVERTVVTAVADYQRQAETAARPALHDPNGMVRRLLASITAYGPLTDVLASPDVEEIFIEGPRVTYLDRSGRLHGLDEPTTEAENRAVVDRLLGESHRTLDARNPMVQARVLDGAARLTAAIPPVAETLSATIRRHSLRRDTLVGLLERGSLSQPAASLLDVAMRASASLLISGPPGSGKTSLLSALLAAVPAGRCVRVCEEIRELNVPLTHGSFYETRPPGIDGTAEISLRDLVRFCLAMRPDVIVIGEVRGAEAFELTRAVNAGCGFACTIHANSGREALEALTNAAIMAGENVPEQVVRRVFSSAIDLVVHLDLTEGTGGPRREVREIVAVPPAMSEGFGSEPVFTRTAPGAPLEWTGVVPVGWDTFDRHLPAGVTLRGLLEGRQGVVG